MTTEYRGKQSADTGAYYAPYAPAGVLNLDYKYLSSDVVDAVTWHRIRAYTLEIIDWVRAQDSNYWNREGIGERDFWLCEELYTMFVLRWS